MQPRNPEPPSPDPNDFGSEHSRPAQQPVTPPAESSPSPLEGFDPDRAGWGAKSRPSLWDRFVDWLEHRGRR